MKKLFFLMSAAVTLFTACNNTDDLYNPNWNGELGVIVPENFDWSTTQTLNVRVDVKDEHHGKYNYHVGIYTESPADGVLPVSVGIAKSGMPFDAAITIPATVNKLYITQTLYHSDGTKSTSVGEAKVEGSNIAYAFTESVKKAGTRATTATSSKYCSLETGREYIANLSLSHGVLDIKTNTTIIGKSIDTNKKYIVRSGAVLTIDGDASSNNSAFIIEEGASILCNGNFEIGSNSNFLNDGSLTVTKTVTIGNGATLFNNGCIIADKVYLKNAVNGGDTIEGAIIMYGDAYIGCHDMEVGSSASEVIISKGTWFNVTNELIVENGDALFRSFDDSKLYSSDYSALFQINKINLAKNRSRIVVDAPILVECPEITGKSYTIANLITEGASDLITVAGTACSGGMIVGKLDLGKYTYCMEDMYPEAGDYDMNDIVMEIHTKGESLDGYITELTFNCKLRAVGATKSIAAYINILGVPQSTIEIGTNPIKLIEDAHTLMGSALKVPVNTDENEEVYPDQSFSIDMKFKKETLLPVNLDMFDFYIIADGTEIHLPNINRTPSYIDGTTIWGVRIPGSFNYMKELMKISDGYTKLNSWIESNKTKDRDWYNYFDKSKVYNK